MNSESRSGIYEPAIIVAHHDIRIYLKGRLQSSKIRSGLLKV